MNSNETESVFAANSTEKRFAIQFARRLAQLRIEAGYSQQNLAYRLHVGVKVYSSWECGARASILKLCHLLRIAKFYGVTLSALFSSAAIAPKGRPGKFKDRGGNKTTATRPLYSKHFPSTRDHAGCDPGSERMCDECRDLWNAAKQQSSKEIACL